MLLVADVGNTNTTLGIFEGPKLRHRLRSSTRRDQTEDECAAVLLQLLAMRGVPHSAVSGVILASVVPSVTEVTSRAMRAAFGIVPVVVGSDGFATGLRVVYDRPEDVGADRIANAVAAHARCGGAIVVDFGTATNFDCVSPEGEYLGGAIAPGVGIGLQALLLQAARLRPVDLVSPPSALANTTARAIQSGVVLGHACLVDGLVAKLRAELSFECQVLATGGLAPVVVPHTSSVQSIDENLTLTGLRLLFERNRRAG